MANSITKAYDNLPKIAKVLIQLIFGIIVSGVYRILKYFETKNLLTLVVGIIFTFTGFGNFIGWVVDLISQIVYDKFVFLAD